MKLPIATVSGSLALAASFGTFLWFAAAADHAMDKSGIGNLAAWETFSQRAGMSLGITVAIWALLLALGLWCGGAEKSQLLFVCGLALLVAPVAWLVAVVA